MPSRSGCSRPLPPWGITIQISGLVLAVRPRHAVRPPGCHTFQLERIAAPPRTAGDGRRKGPRHHVTPRSLSPLLLLLNKAQLGGRSPSTQAQSAGEAGASQSIGVEAAAEQGASQRPLDAGARGVGVLGGPEAGLLPELGEARLKSGAVALRGWSRSLGQSWKESLSRASRAMVEGLGRPDAGGVSGGSPSRTWAPVPRAQGRRGRAWGSAEASCWRVDCRPWGRAAGLCGQGPQDL